MTIPTNSKFRTGPKEAPTEPFKRAVTGCLRALARKPELEVAFAAERPGLMGGKVRLPEPPRKLGKAEFALGDVYAAEHGLARLHPANRHVRPKIRQQLQILRDLGFVQFLGGGEYRLS